jgi:hypothetical protein
MRNEQPLSVIEMKHWVLIKVWDKLGGNVIEIMRWEGLPWSMIDMRWGNNGDERTAERIQESKFVLYVFMYLIDIIYF